MLCPNQSSIIVQKDFYSGARNLIDTILNRRLKAEIITSKDTIESIEELIKNSNTKLLHLESPSNPKIDVYDIQGIANICNKHGCLLSIDNTLASPLF
mmetsp:Transcript_37675/g.27767  ORF Transcript_37675/g.27767 Transcript_37675/m.27767 type:complete len:98 (+) Transcript_37675:256-549(+)